MNRKGHRVFSRQYNEILCLLVMVSLLVGLMGPGRIVGAQGGVTVDGAGSSATADGVSSLDISHTTGTGTDRLMLVGVSANSYGGVRTISSVTFTYDTTVLTLSQVGSVENEAGRLAAVYGLLNPPSGQAGTVTVTFSGSVGNGIVAGVVNFAGVDQTTPYGTYASNTGTDTTPTVNVVTTAGDLVFDTVFLGAQTIGTLAAGDSQTAQWSATIDRVGGAGSIEEATGTSVTMSWTVSGGATSRFWAIGAVPIKPAAAGPTQDLTIAVSPSGGGTTVPAAGVHTYAQNAVVDITATANVGYVFGTWSGACSGTDPEVCQVTMDADKTVTANFAAIPQYDLTVSVAGSGSVTLDPAGGTYYEGTTVTLTPVPGACYVFNDWAGADAADLTDNGDGTWSITMDGNKSVTADFAALPQYTLTADDDGHGSVTLDPAGGTYCTGTTVTLTPLPDPGYILSSWSGTNSGDLTDNGDGTWSITMDANKSVMANFGAALWPTLDGTVSSGTGAPTASSISFSHTTGTGSNRLVLVGVSWNCGSTDRTISSITFTPDGGSAVSLAEVITQLYNWSTSYRYTAIYSLLNPPSGVAGTVDITFSGAVSNGSIAGAANFAGVDQTTPLGTPDGAVGTGTSSSGTPNPALTLTGLAGNELVFDSVFIGASNTSHTMTPDAGQTALWNVLGYSSSSTSFNMRGAASTKPATGASVPMSWTTEGYGTTATRWAIAAVPINPAAEVETGTIIIEKQTEPDGWTEKDFDFTGAAVGSIADDEQIVVSDLQAGVYSVQEVVPAGWTLADIVCDDDNSVGNLPNFEAEFHLEAGETVKCTFYNLLELDFGDAPDSYQTLLASDGARHAIVVGHSLGPLVDAEPDGQPSVAADLDDLVPTPDDEDGVTLPATLTSGDPAASVSVAGGLSGGMLDAWLDFDGNGAFDHPAEHLWGGASHALVAGPNSLTFAVPVTAVPGPTYARFRLSNAGNLAPFGLAPDGEVEDYTVEIVDSIVCYALTLGHSGSGTAPVADLANSTGCPTGEYVAGETINLSGATPDLGWGIAGWYGTDNDGSRADTNVLTMPASAHAAGVNYLRLLGDINLDGLVNSSDALLVLSVDVGLPAAGYCPMNYGDVDGDGLVNSTDALIILSYDAGLPVGTSLVGQPVPEPVLSQQPPGCTLGSMGLSRWSWVPMP